MDDDFGAWIGHTETTIDPLGPVQPQAAQAMLDELGPALDAGDPLPPRLKALLGRDPADLLDRAG